MDVYTIRVYAYMARHEHGDGVVRLEDDLSLCLLRSKGLGVVIGSIVCLCRILFLRFRRRRIFARLSCM
jgi:hypothetical protein